MTRKFLLALMIILIAGSAYASSTVTLAKLHGTIGVQAEEYIREVIESSAGSSLVVIELDTPGGLVESMRGIVQSILNAPVPVCVWVPPGGRAASAGAFIVQASHVAAMSAGTNIGAAHPVQAGGSDIASGDMSQKVMNDLRAQMRSVVQLRGRNVETAERMITESISLTATEALRAKTIDIIASDVQTLLKAVQGRKVSVNGASVRIALESPVSVQRVEMSLAERIIQFISSPEIAYLLLSGGMAAIFFEVITPGGFILGTTGGVMLLLGAIGLKMLPFSWAGIILLASGIILMVVDLLAGTSGLLTLLGLPVFCLGGVFMFRAPGGELLRYSVSVALGLSLSVGICFGVCAFLVLKGLRRKVSTGRAGMIGQHAEVISVLDGTTVGQVKCHGEIWNAISTGQEMRPGQFGMVKALEGMRVIIE